MFYLIKYFVMTMVAIGAFFQYLWGLFWIIIAMSAVGFLAYFILKISLAYLIPQLFS